MYSAFAHCLRAKQNGPQQQFDWSEDEDPDAGALNDAPSDSEDDSAEEDEDGRVTIRNMERKSRALDAKADREAKLDLAELQEAEEDGAEDADEFDDADFEPFDLPTAEQRKAATTEDPQDVYKRMRACAMVLGNFKKYAQEDRCVETLVSYFLLRLMTLAQRARRICRADYS